MKIISISKILQDKQIAAVITTPITRYSPLFKSDLDESTEKRIRMSVRHLSIGFLKQKVFILYYKLNYI